MVSSLGGFRHGIFSFYFLLLKTRMVKRSDQINSVRSERNKSYVLTEHMTVKLSAYFTPHHILDSFSKNLEIIQLPWAKLLNVFPLFFLFFFHFHFLLPNPMCKSTDLKYLEGWVSWGW